MSGYCACACRDCFEIAIADDMDNGAFCADCEDAGCERGKDCQRPDAYGCDESEAE